MRSDLIAHINLDHLRHNFESLRARVGPKVRICAPLKADAYGHGIHVVAPALQRLGCDFAAVANVPEAVELRQLGWTGEILLLGNTLAVLDEDECRERIEAITHHHLTVTIAEPSAIEKLAVRPLLWANEPIDVHLKLDTGMGRMGVMPSSAEDLARRILSAPHLKLRGVYSHFATADLSLTDLVDRQLSAFREIMSRLGDFLPPGVIRHFANSAATIALPQAHYDMVRPGLSLYGYHPGPQFLNAIDLKPILRVLSHVTLIKDLAVGHCVGYGQTFTTSRPTRLGIVPAGYFDGFVRSLSNLGAVGVAGGIAPVIGRISMDQLAIDLTDLPAATLGSEVVLVDDRPQEPHSVARIADRLGTIPYEVTCLLGPRINRIPVGENGAFSG
ncbi:MAG TPA: alanine racemase, partial [Phycisphaerae bacterium]|nr:alanine racemase [Phycisphaerae bacterium]